MAKKQPCRVEDNYTSIRDILIRDRYATVGQILAELKRRGSVERVALVTFDGSSSDTHYVKTTRIITGSDLLEADDDDPIGEKCNELICIAYNELMSEAKKLFRKMGVKEIAVTDAKHQVVHGILFDIQARQGCGE